MTGPTDGNLYALRQREAEREAYEARFIDCPECGGTGMLDVPIGFHTGDPRVDDWDEVTCWRCEGHGTVEAEDADD